MRGVLCLFKSPVARTNKANPEQEELQSFQAPVASVDSSSFLDEKGFFTSPLLIGM